MEDALADLINVHDQWRTGGCTMFFQDIRKDFLTNILKQIFFRESADAVYIWKFCHKSKDQLNSYIFL